MMGFGQRYLLTLCFGERELNDRTIDHIPLPEGVDPLLGTLIVWFKLEHVTS